MLTLNKKGQSMIMEFVLFFMIGIGLFTVLGNFFRAQSDSLKDDLSKTSLELINSHFSSLVISSITGCDNCGSIEHNIKLSKTYANNVVKISLDDSGFVIETIPGGQMIMSTINNLNEDIDVINSGEVYSYRDINITYVDNEDGSLLNIEQD